MIIEAQVPRIIEVDDYHQLEIVEGALRLVNRRLKCREIGFLDGKYLGLIYFNKLPDKKAIEKMVDQHR